jgi:uncharacterized surface protein with fasciclin (FAS1) repeats
MKRTIAVAVAVTAGIILTACGSSTSTETTTAASSMAASAPASSMASPAEATTGTIVDVASASDDFSTLVAALSAAGLVETLQGPGPFTVFAPTNEAFAALPAGVLDKLLLPENKDALTKILTYHVLSGQVMAADVTDGDAATVEGQTVALSTADGVTVNGAKVITADVVTSNGVIHAIDAVILPPDVDVASL